MNESESESQKKAQRANAQVGTWVIPKSKTGTAGSPCEGLHPINPPPKAKRKRPAPIPVRASDVQRAAIKAKAGNAGISVNQFMLQQALGTDLVPAKLTPEDRVARAGALRAYRGTGTLLNQIAKHLNSGRIIGAVDVAGAIKRHEDNASRMLEAFIKGLPQ
ncbi:MAG: hypothetical protein WCD70_03545 [Alphaproteobacteria bacterium]